MRASMHDAGTYSSTLHLYASVQSLLPTQETGIPGDHGTTIHTCRTDFPMPLGSFCITHNAQVLVQQENRSITRLEHS
jgi:hypothetical protein